MNTARRVAATLLAAAAGLALTACGPTSPAASPAASPAPTATNDTAGAPTDVTPTGSVTSPGQQTSPAATHGTNPEDQMRIAITIGDQRFHATLKDSPASRDLLAQLPVTLRMDDHASVEKTGALPSPVSLDGQPAGADPDVGDVGYYAPGNDLVLYYGDMSYNNGIVILGRLDGDAAQRIADIEGFITATVTALND